MIKRLMVVVVVEWIKHMILKGRIFKYTAFWDIINRTKNKKYRPSPLKPESSGQLTNEGFPLPIPKSLTPQFHPTMKKEGEESKFFCQPKTTLNVFDYNRKTGR